MVSTYTAEAELADDDIQNLGDVWQTNQTATEMAKGEWDCLVRSGGGRFLWLQLEFRGNGQVTPRLDSIETRISAHQFAPLPAGGVRQRSRQRRLHGSFPEPLRYHFPLH